MLVATFPGVKYSPLYYRCLEREKTQTLSACGGNFERVMTLKKGSSLEQLRWWSENVSLETTAYPLTPRRVSMLVTSDASFTGWGGTAKVIMMACNSERITTDKVISGAAERAITVNRGTERVTLGKVTSGTERVTNKTTCDTERVIMDKVASGTERVTASKTTCGTERATPDRVASGTESTTAGQWLREEIDTKNTNYLEMTPLWC